MKHQRKRHLRTLQNAPRKSAGQHIDRSVQEISCRYCICGHAGKDLSEDWVWESVNVYELYASESGGQKPFCCE